MHALASLSFRTDTAPRTPRNLSRIFHGHFSGSKDQIYPSLDYHSTSPTNWILSHMDLSEPGHEK